MSKSNQKEKPKRIVTKEEMEKELEEIPLDLHTKPENVNKIGGIPSNIFDWEESNINFEKQGKLSAILIRKQTQNLIKKIKKGISRKQVLYGSNGAGKSYTLYHIAAYFSQFHVSKVFSQINYLINQTYKKTFTNFSFYFYFYFSFDFDGNDKPNWKKQEKIKRNQNSKSNSKNHTNEMDEKKLIHSNQDRFHQFQVDEKENINLISDQKEEKQKRTKTYGKKQEKWVVLYLNDLNSLINESSFYVAKRIMEDLFHRYGKKLFQTCKFDFEEDLFFSTKFTTEMKEEIIESCRNFLQNLFYLKTHKFRILIAIDEFNILYREKFDINHILNVFRYFPSIRNGMLLVALSSSFDHHKIPDLNLLLYGTEIRFYNKFEFNSICKWKQKERKLPQKNSIKTFQKFTNQVPQMLDIVSLTYQNWKDYDQTTNDFTYQCVSNSIDFYQTRIEYFLEKIFQNKNDSSFYQQIIFPTLVYLNHNLNVLPPIWEKSGLFYHILLPDENNRNQKNFENKKATHAHLNANFRKFQKKKKILPICEFVKEAIIQIFQLQEINFIRTLCSLNIRGWAFELFVLNLFHSQINSQITLDNFDLKGNKGIPKSFEIKIKNFIHQEREKPLKKIEVGDFIVCFGNHWVIDFVCLSKNQEDEKELFYIQVSVQKYNQHSKKVDDLFSLSEFSIQEKKVSLLEYYSNLAGMKFDSEKINLLSNQEKNEENQEKNEFKEKSQENQFVLPQNQYYVYITAENYWETTSQFSFDPVILVNANSLSLLKPSFSLDQIKDFFISKSKQSN
ncbi:MITOCHONDRIAL 28S ribosomal protein S29 [Anaeramoeba ignava]|uniref:MITOCHONDRIAL 28S ribosomal protein S29 n=1 Tax=Anaeramoeba ignava TaxID=1746090 RepID=A0A9Q0R8S2_ANAIG|nr:MITOCHONDRIAL 28S ribosomal protein S29 [Anaeramoeba ignava]